MKQIMQIIFALSKGEEVRVGVRVRVRRVRVRVRVIR